MKTKFGDYLVEDNIFSYDLPAMFCMSLSGGLAPNAKK